MGCTGWVDLVFPKLKAIPLVFGALVAIIKREREKFVKGRWSKGNVKEER